jgi:hypothetical protein
VDVEWCVADHERRHAVGIVERRRSRGVIRFDGVLRAVIGRRGLVEGRLVDTRIPIRHRLVDTRIPIRHRLVDTGIAVHRWWHRSVGPHGLAALAARP